MRRARLPALSSPSDHKPGFLREQSRVLGRQVSARVVGNPLVARLITRYFHRLYYGMRARTWLDTHWLGTPLLKCPLDLWIYQELLHEIRPHLIVETGTRYGGSAAYLASLCDLLDHGRASSASTSTRRRGGPSTRAFAICMALRRRPSASTL